VYFECFLSNFLDIYIYTCCSSSSPQTRSPEECRGNQSLTYKVDTYGLGTVFFFLLTQNRVHNLNSDAPGPADEHIEWYRERVKEGEEPEIPHTIVSMSNQAVIAIINGMKMAMTPDPRKRPSATEIADYLDDEYWQYVDASMKNWSHGGDQLV